MISELPFLSEFPVLIAVALAPVIIGCFDCQFEKPVLELELDRSAVVGSLKILKPPEDRELPLLLSCREDLCIEDC